jgi:hypothetical protein
MVGGAHLSAGKDRVRSVYLFKRLAGLQQDIFLALRDLLRWKGSMCKSGILAKIAGGVIYSCARGLGVGQGNPLS